MRHYGLDEQINHLRESGITFSIMSEDDARTFLRENTYYYKLKSYRHNYRRGDDGKFSCDFAHLVELSRMDIALSRLCLDHCLAIEHALKVWLNAQLMEENDPGMADRILRESGVSWHTEQTPAPSNHTLRIYCSTAELIAPYGIGGNSERSLPRHAYTRHTATSRDRKHLSNISYSLCESCATPCLTVLAYYRRYTFPLPYTRQVQIRRPLSTIKFFVKACGYADATPLPNLLGRVHWERATKNSSYTTIPPFSTLICV